MKFATERNYWGNEFRFRIQPDGKSFYAVRHDRFGTFTLLRSAGGHEAVLATSVGKLDAGQAQWTWVRVKTEGNRFRVWACTDGVSFENYLDYTDAECTTSTGKLAFAGCNRFRFAFLDNPWNNDAGKRSRGAWLTSVQQGQGFRQRAGSDYIQDQILVEYFVENPAKAPETLSVECDGQKNLVPSSKSTIGYHREAVLADVRREGSSGKVEVTLSRGADVIDRATSSATNTMNSEQLAQTNPKPESGSDSAAVSKADYMACLDKAFDPVWKHRAARLGQSLGAEC